MTKQGQKIQHPRRNRIARNRLYDGGGLGSPVGSVDPLVTLLESVAFDGAGDLLIGWIAASDYITTDINGVKTWLSTGGAGVGAYEDTGVTTEQPGFTENGTQSLVDNDGNDKLLLDANAITTVNAGLSTNDCTHVVICEFPRTLSSNAYFIGWSSAGAVDYMRHRFNSSDSKMLGAFRADSGTASAATTASAAKAGIKARSAVWVNDGSTASVIYDGVTATSGTSGTSGDMSAFSSANAAIAAFGSSAPSYDGRILGHMVYPSVKSAGDIAAIVAAWATYTGLDLTT